MTYKALTKQEYQSFKEAISLLAEGHEVKLLEIINNLSIEHNVSVRNMIDLCIVPMIVIMKQSSDDIKVETVISAVFEHHGIAQNHTMLSINGNQTHILIHSEVETIVKLEDTKHFCMALFGVHSNYHKSTLKEFSILLNEL